MIQIHVRRAACAALLVLPGLALVLMAVRSGGFFPDVIAVAALAALACLVVRALLGPAPGVAVTPALVAAVVGLAGFAIWILASSHWSHAPARALLEYDRALLYAATLVLFGLLGASPARARGLLYGLALGALAITVAALGVWLLPGHYPVDDHFLRARLSWPTSYWNTSGLIGALCAVACLAITCDGRAVWPARVLAAAGVPLGGAVIFFTVSRGALLAGAVGVVVLLVLGRSRTMLAGLLATIPTTAAAVLVSHAAHGKGLELVHPTQTGIDAGSKAAVQLAVMAGAAMGLRALGLALDAQLASIRGPVIRPLLARAAAGGVLVAAVVAFLALGGPHQVSRGYDKFTSDSVVKVREAPSERFTELGNNGRIDHWKVALHNGYDPHPLRGSGAGTFALLWAEHRKTSFTVIDGHSLEIETLGELGIVGLALLALALLTMFGALGRRAWVEKGAWAGLTAAGVGWLAQASVDWLWETPAVTVWLFAAGGLALGAPVARRLAVVPAAAAAGAGAGEPPARAAAPAAERPPVSAVAAPGGGGPVREAQGPDAEASHDRDAPVGEAAVVAGPAGEDARGEDARDEDARGEDARGEAPGDGPPAARGATPRRRRPWAGWVARIALAAAAAVLAITPVLVHRSQTHLDDAVAAFRQGDCAAATGDALASHDALASRPEPFELLAYCDARAGRRALAVHAIEAAVARDPGDWEFRYDEAIVRAATGLDPRPATRAAVARNPRDARVRDAARWFLHGKHRLWRKRGREAPTIIPPR
jgi:hypothetical protein